MIDRQTSHSKGSAKCSQKVSNAQEKRSAFFYLFTKIFY